MSSLLEMTMNVVANVILLLAPIFAQELEESEIIYQTEPYTVENKQLGCIEVVNTDSDLTFQQTDEQSQKICGVFFLGDVDDVISVEVVDTNMNCDDDEVLEIFDGWLTQKGMLPNEIDHEVPLSERVVRYCDWVRSGQQDSLVFVSTQNVALVQYRLKTENFLTFRFRKVHSEKSKCHVVTPLSTGEYTMTSVRGRNCTFFILQPTRLLIKKIHFDEFQGRESAVEIFSGEALDVTYMEVVHKFTSNVIDEEIRTFSLPKTHTAVRMTSSTGFHENKIVFRYFKLEQEKAEPEACEEL